METGNNHILNNTKKPLSQLISGNNISINLRYDGCTFLVAGPNGKHILEIATSPWPASRDIDYIINQCQKFFDDEHIILKAAASVHWLLSFSKFSLIPDIFYQKGNGKFFLSHSSRLEEDEQIFSDFWPKRDIVGVYAVSTRLQNWIMRQFEKSTMAHSSHAINALYSLQPQRTDFNFLLVHDAFAEFFIAREGKVLFYSQFPFEVDEDLVYYILFALEQNRVLPTEMDLKTAGNIQKDSSLYKLLSTYIGQLSDIGIPPGIISPQHLSRNQLRQSANIIASLSCAL